MSSQSIDQVRKILIAVDGSDHSLAAVSFISDLSMDNITCPECVITLIGALNPLNSATHAAYKPPLLQAQKMLQSRCFQVQTELILGYPAEILINYAEENNPDLIVLGAKGLRATLGILLGGVAQQVIEYAKCPVLIVRAPYKPIAHVLLVTDGSDSSIGAAKFIAGFPLPKHTSITIAHVLHPTPILEPARLMQSWYITDEIIQDIQTSTMEELQAAHEEEEKRGQEILNQTAHIFDGLINPINTVLLRGDAATEIINYSKTHSVDLIVAASRGLSEMKAWLLGSVSRKLVHYASCSVLIVRKQTNTEPMRGDQS